MESIFDMMMKLRSFKINVLEKTQIMATQDWGSWISYSFIPCGKLGLNFMRLWAATTGGLNEVSVIGGLSSV